MEDKVHLPVTVTATETEMKTSSVASELTGNDAVSSNFVEQEESSVSESQKEESSKWTNEKHSLYLKSMEASFVDQLYKSSDMQSWKTQKDCSSDSISSRKNHASTPSACGQFKVLQHGFWSKINRSREHPKLKAADRSHVSPGNPWIQHFRNGNKHGAVASPSLQERPSTPATAQPFPVSESQFSHQELGCSNTEVTDQNFTEEDAKMEKAEGSRGRKRMRPSVVSYLSNDQVVPFGPFPPSEIAHDYISPRKQCPINFPKVVLTVEAHK